MSEKQVTTDAQVIEANVTRPGRRLGRYAMVAAALLALGGAAALWQSTRLLRQVDARVDAAAGASAAELRAQIDTLNQRIESLGPIAGSVDTVRQELSARLDGLTERQAALQQQVNSAVSGLASNAARDDRDWVLEDVQQLLEIAEQRLRLSRDVPTAIAAAESADRRLVEVGDPSLIPVREQLIADLAALRSVPVVDTAGISLTLASLVDRVEELPLKVGDVTSTATAGEAPPAAAESGSGWRATARQIWKDLLGLIDVRSATVPDDVIFNPEKRYLLQQGLRLELAAARLDALRGATPSFRTGIARIDAQLERYFDTQAAPVAAARESLAALRDVDLSPALPGFEKSIQLLATQREAAAAARAVPTERPLPADQPAAPGEVPTDDAAAADETAPDGGTELHVQPAPPDMGLTPPVDATVTAESPSTTDPSGGDAPAADAAVPPETETPAPAATP